MSYGEWGAPLDDSYRFDGPEEPVDDELESLADTPEGQGLETIADSADTRNRTPEPPAYLDVHFILRNRERVRRYLATGEFTWPELNPAAVAA